MHQSCPLYRDFTMASLRTRWIKLKILVLITNFFSLNFTSIEIGGERVGSNQKERTFGDGGGGSKTNKDKQGGRDGAENSGILSERTCWMFPNITFEIFFWYVNFSSSRNFLEGSSFPVVAFLLVQFLDLRFKILRAQFLLTLELPQTPLTMLKCKKFKTEIRFNLRYF